jgi:hypothetical protein
MFRSLALLSVLLASAQGLAVPGSITTLPDPPSLYPFLMIVVERDYSYNSTSSVNAGDISVQNNVDLNVSASPSSVAGINANIDVNDSVSYGNEAIDVDTYIEIDVNGNECMVNSVGVTIKTKINGIWYDQNNLPQVTSKVASQMPAQPSNTMAAPSRKPITPPSYSSSTSTPSTTTSPTTTASTTTTSTPTTSTTSTPTPSGFISGEGVYGISWDPFKGTDQSCKTPSEQ